MHAVGRKFDSCHLHHFLASARFFILEVIMLTLDLHGLRHEDAKRKLELFINDHWGKMLKIITGHSSSMRGIVSSTAQYYDLDFTCCPLGTYIIIKSH